LKLVTSFQDFIISTIAYCYIKNFFWIYKHINSSTIAVQIFNNILHIIKSYLIKYPQNFIISTFSYMYIKNCFHIYQQIKKVILILFYFKKGHHKTSLLFKIGSKKIISLSSALLCSSYILTSGIKRLVSSLTINYQKTRYNEQRA